LTDGSNSTSALSDHEQTSIITDALKDHSKLYYVLRQRHELLSGLLKHWQAGDLSGTLSSLHGIKDPNLFCDALACTFSETQIASKPLSLLSLDQAQHLISRCVEVMHTDKFKTHL